MKTGKLIIGIIVVIILHPGNHALCQEAEATTGIKYGEQVKWKMVQYLKFLPGKGDRGRSIFRRYFRNANKMAGWENDMFLEMKTGEWHIIAIWELTEGPDELTWRRHPNQDAWLAALDELVGGEEERKALFQEFNSLVADRKRELAISRPPLKPKSEP